MVALNGATGRNLKKRIEIKFNIFLLINTLKWSQLFEKNSQLQKVDNADNVSCVLFSVIDKHLNLSKNQLHVLENVPTDVPTCSLQ